MIILVTGARGMLSEAIQKEFSEHQLILTDKDSLDVRIYNDVIGFMKTLQSGVDFVFHFAAETDLEICERDPGHAYYTNTIGTFNVTQLANLMAVPIVYMSTAGVFSGYSNTPYMETSMPCPLNIYGRSKYYGELAVMRYPRHYIFRMSWLYGGGPEKDKKFVNKVIQLIKGGRISIQAIDDYWGSPCYSRDAAKTIKNYIMQAAPSGIYHIAGQGRATRYDVACEIVKILDKEVMVNPVKDTAFNEAYPCMRSKNEVLDTIYPELSKMRPWKEALTEYIREYYV